MNPIPSRPLQLSCVHPQDPDWIGVPRFWGLDTFGTPKDDKRQIGLPLSFQSDVSRPLRPIQIDALSSLLKSVRSCGGAFLQADCGFGKTPTSLAAIAALGRKAMIICNRSELMTQLEADIKGLPRRWPDGTPTDDKENKCLVRHVCASCANGLSSSAVKKRTVYNESNEHNEHQKQCDSCAVCGVEFSSPTEIIQQSVLPARQAWLPMAKVALLQGQWLENDKREAAIKDADIIICCVNSLATCIYPSWLINSIGTVIVDEAHHIAAQTLSQAIPRLPARYIIGVSATPNRSDGLEKVLYWLLGPLCFKYQRTPETTGIKNSVCIDFVEYTKGNQTEIIYKDGRLGFSAMCVALSRDDTRNTLIINQIERCVTNGRKRILVLTSFREHLLCLCTKLRLLYGHDCVSVLHGKATPMERAQSRASTTRIIIATFSFVEEGYDDDTIDTLILACPKSRIQQSVGRVERSHPDKAVPLVIDIVDTWSIFQRMRYKRRLFYKSRGFRIGLAQDQVSSTSVTDHRPAEREKPITVTSDASIHTLMDITGN